MNRNACKPCALDERSHSLQACWDAGPFLLSCLDHDGRYLQVNQRYAAYWSIETATIRGRRFQEILPRQLHEKHEKLFAECLRGKTMEFSDEDIGSDYHGVYTPICTDGGKVRRVMVVITAPQLNSLSQTAASAPCGAKEFLLSLPGAGMIANQLGVIVEVFDDNQLLPPEARDWPGQQLQAVFPVAAARELTRELDRAISSGRLQFTVCKLKCGDTCRSFHVRIAPLRYQHKGIATAACYWMDATGLPHAPDVAAATDFKQQQQDLLNMLLERRALPSREILDHAWRLNLNLSQDFSCYAVVRKANGKDGDSSQETATDAALVEKLNKEPGVIAWQTREGVAVLIPASIPPGRKRELERAVRWKSLFCDCAPGQYSIGIAPFQTETFWKLAKVYEQARLAVTWGQKLRPGQQIHHYLDNGVFQFFPAVRNTEHVQDFVERTLGRLEQYDQQHGTDLMDTLIKILQVNNLQEVARQMYTHRQTVLFRKRRIEEILDISLNDFEARLAIGMALKLRQGFDAKPAP
ncbi:MAG: PAS domain-containing protein [Sporomusaceae bacterium]|nr:PAS domain-containing protein [Sporomusaceae bacterium]